MVWGEGCRIWINQAGEREEGQRERFMGAVKEDTFVMGVTGEAVEIPAR